MLDSKAVDAQLLFAEAATQHPDGTFSVLRGGITAVWATAPPIALDGVLVARIIADSADRGSHEFDLACMDEDGKPGGPTLKGQFDVPTGGGNVNLIMGYAMRFPKHGRYTFNLRVDNVLRGELTLTAAKQPPTAT